jgi:hypothetical protein
MQRTRLTSIMIFLTVAAIHAQIPVRNNIIINVTATVISNSPIELTTLNNMAIKIDNKQQKEIYISPISDPGAGLMLAKCRPGSQVRLTYMIQEEITEENGSGKIKLNYEMSGYPSRVQSASSLFLTGEALLNFGIDGIYYLWIGGRINLSNALPGKYKGQFTLEIVYI